MREATITVVSGAPGAGKTVALAQWAAAGQWPGPVAWLTLDEYDDVAGRFWRHLAAALARAGIRLPADGSAGGPDAPLLIASVLARQQPPAVLVLDNLHLLRDPGICGGLSYLFRHARPGLRVLVGTRTGSLVPLQQHVLAGDLAEVSGSQLAFTGPETRLLLQRYDLTAYRESLLPLIKQTEGWAAGLRFVLLALTGGSGAGTGDPASAAQLINGYLSSEALDTQPPGVREFLLRTSVPEMVSPDLAQALTDQADSAVTLADLVRANVFIQPSGDGHCYRYHPLFRAALRARLRSEDPRLHHDLLTRTAEWLRRHGRLAEAVRYAASVGDGRLAMRMAVDELAVSRLLDLDRGQGLARELHGISTSALTWPQEYVSAAAVAAAYREYGSAARWLDRADESLGRLPPDGEMPSRLSAAVVRFELARCGGDLEALHAAAAEQGTLMSRMPAGIREGHPEVTVQVLSSRGYSELWHGHFDAAEKVLARAAALPLPEAAAGDRAECLGRLALAHALNGHLGRAAEFAARSERTRVRADGSDAGPEPPPNVPSDAALALVHMERAELPAVRASLRRVEAGLRVRQDRAAAAVAGLVAARLHCAEGRPSEALSVLARMRQGWSPAGWLEHELTLAEAWAEVMSGNPRAALDAVDRCPSMPGMAAHVARAHAWAAAGDSRAAALRELRCVFEVTAAEPARELDRSMIDALLIDARIRYASGERAAGRASLVRAMRIARSEDIRLPFEMEHLWLFPVLRADAELARGYQLLSGSGAASQGNAVLRSLAAAAGPALVEPLSDREREVLQRVAQLLSTAEIANELYISVNTVKTHLKSVHRKLAVTHRREAVRRARQLNLI